MINVRPKVRDESPEPEAEQASHFVRRPGLGEPVQASRPLDPLFAGILLGFTFPLLLTVALAIKCESRGPVFDKQPCIGRGGRRFQALSFRTTDYEQPRVGWARPVTRVGEFLRYTRIDCLPQPVGSSCAV